MYFIFAFLGFFCVVSAQSKITYYSDIRPIISKNCVSCHQTGEIAPFSLVTYEDVKRKAKTIKKVVSNRYMPPYYADPHYSKLANPLWLSEKEIKLINEWVENGSEKGIETQSKVEIQKSEKSKPDLILNVERVAIKGDDKEKFYHIKIPFELPFPQQVCKCEFIPGNRKVVHHMDAFVYSYKPNSNVWQGARIADGDILKDERSIYYHFSLFNADGSPATKNPTSILDFFPGMKPNNFPKGIFKSFDLPQKGVILLSTIHYGGSPIDTFDNSKIHLFFCKEKVQRKVMSYIIGSPDHKIEPKLIIKANKIQTFTTKQLLSNDISLLAVQPHAHLLGKSFKVYAKTKEGITIPILKINKWDLRWQQSYKLKKMLRIPAKATIIFEGEYDNTSQNPFNPYSPPRDIPESIRTKDEMLQLWLDFIPYQKGDEAISLEK